MRAEVANLRRRGQGSYLTLDCADVLMDLRMSELGFCRHPLQVETPADGCFGVWAVAAQLYNTGVTEEMKQKLREEVVNTLPHALEQGLVDWQGLGSLQSPQDWMQRMSQKAVFVDAVWLQLAAALFQRDFVLVPVFPERWPGGIWRLFGRPGDTPAPGAPVLLMIAEDTQFMSPHYQVFMQN